MAERAKRGRLAKLLTLAVSLLIALLLGEVAVRIVLPRPYADVDVSYPMVKDLPFAGDAIGLLPHATIFAQYDRDPCDTLPEGERVVYRLNDWGFRDVRNESRLGREGPALVVLGDSFTFGAGVEARDCYTNVLADALPSGVTVFNLAIPGYGTEDERKLAETVLPRIRPDAVLVGYCLNDPAPAWSPGYAEVFGFDLVVRRDKEIDVPDSPSHLLRLLLRAIHTRDLTEKTLAWYRSLYESPGDPWIATQKDLLRIRNGAEAVGARLGVVVFPMFIGLESDYPLTAAHRTVTDWCGENGIPVLDTLPLFLGTQTDKLIVHPKDRHPNAAAHATIGKAAAEFVRTELLEGN